jgi:phage portal protein BeeE
VSSVIRVDLSASVDAIHVPSTAEQVWDSLKQSNADLAESFHALSKLASADRDAYETEVQKLAMTTSDEVRPLSGSPHR